LISTDHSISDWELKWMHKLKGRPVTASTSTSASSASVASTSTTSTPATVKDERTRGPPQKHNYRGMMEAEKTAAKKALTAERLAHEKAEIKDLWGGQGNSYILQVVFSAYNSAS
jgi:hypothetical protein